MVCMMKKNQAGLSLLEVLFSIAILAMMMAAIAGGFSQFNRVSVSQQYQPPHQQLTGVRRAEPVGSRPARHNLMYFPKLSAALHSRMAPQAILCTSAPQSLGKSKVIRRVIQWIC